MAKKQAFAPSAEQLGKQIEQLVRNFIEESKRAAAVAVERGFANALEGASADKAVARTARPRNTAQRDRRRTDEIQALVDRLYQFIASNPGRTMTDIARGLGESSRALQFPAARLKRDGHIRMVGNRNQARYFPLTRVGSA